jgi:hypothetical protein
MTAGTIPHTPHLCILTGLEPAVADFQLHQPLHLDQAYTLIHSQDFYVSKGGPFMIGTLRIKGIRFQISF